MPLHPVRLPGLRGRRRRLRRRRRRGGCSRPRHRLRGRARRPWPQVGAIPGRGRSGPLHVQTRGEPGWRGQDRAQSSGCRGPRRGKPGCAQGRPRSIGEAAGSRSGCGWVTGGDGDCTSGAPGAHGPRTAHQPRRAAECRARWRRWQGRRWCLQEGGERGGSERQRGSVMWAPRPPTPPREDGQTGRGRGGALAGPRGRGSEGRRGRGFPHLLAATRGPGPPGAGRGMGACRDSPFVPRGVGRSAGQEALSSLGWDGDRAFQAPAPPPRARPPQLPRALCRRRRRRRLLRPLGPAFCSRPGGGGGGGGSSRSPGARQARAVRAGGRRGPLAIRPGAPRARTPLHSFRCRRGRQAGAGGGEAGRVLGYRR